MSNCNKSNNCSCDIGQLLHFQETGQHMITRPSTWSIYNIPSISEQEENNVPHFTRMVKNTFDTYSARWFDTKCVVLATCHECQAQKYVDSVYATECVLLNESECHIDQQPKECH